MRPVLVGLGVLALVFAPGVVGGFAGHAIAGSDGAVLGAAGPYFLAAFLGFAHGLGRIVLGQTDEEGW